MIDLRRLVDTHNDENIVEVVISLLQMYDLDSKLEYFIDDNVDFNDTAICHILQALRLDIKESDSRRVRCIRHIINLVAKTFLFEQDVESLKNKHLPKTKISDLQTVRKDWLTRGPYGKLRKTVDFICDTSQQRDQ